MPPPILRTETQRLVNDLNNVLFLVMAHAERLSEALDLGSPEHDSAEAITRAALRGAGVINRLRCVELAASPSTPTALHVRKAIDARARA